MNGAGMVFGIGVGPGTTGMATGSCSGVPGGTLGCGDCAPGWIGSPKPDDDGSVAASDATGNGMGNG